MCFGPQISFGHEMSFIYLYICAAVLEQNFAIAVSVTVYTEKMEVVKIRKKLLKLYRFILFYFSFLFLIRKKGEKICCQINRNRNRNWSVFCSTVKEIKVSYLHVQWMSVTWHGTASTTASVAVLRMLGNPSCENCEECATWLINFSVFGNTMFFFIFKIKILKLLKKLLKMKLKNLKKHFEK